MSLADKIKRYAEVALTVGVNIQEGQILHIRADVASVPLVREVVRVAYKLGAKDVVVEYNDDVLIRERLENAPLSALETYYDWNVAKYEGLSADNAAFLAIYAQSPEALKGIDPERIAIAQKTAAMALKNWKTYIQSDKVSWSIIAMPTKEWAEMVFPNDENCVDKLWEAILEACRINESDPVSAWETHNNKLLARVAYLNNKKYRKLHFKDKGTDLTIGLHPSHLWSGGASVTTKGIPFTANIPTEEVFTAPLCTEVDGVVASTKPLSYAGNIIDRFSLTFKKGKVVEFTAEQGEEILKNLLNADPGAKQLGEVALVPHDSPISNSGHLYFQTLFDENASNHVALGSGYAFCVENGKHMVESDLIKSGVNQSIVHVDFMIGSETMDIDGILPDGTVEPVFRKGNWAV